MMAFVYSRPGLAAQPPQFHGYLSQGIIYSGDNPFYDKRTGTNLNARELGLNVSWSMNDKVRFAGQLLSRKAGGLDNGRLRVDFLLVDYNFFINEKASAGVRLGRVKNPYGLYNTTRDVPHARPGVFVPQSVYFESLRGPLLSSDGGDLYFSFNNELADFNFDVYGGKSHFDNKALEYQLYQTDMPGKFDNVDIRGIKAVAEPKALPDLTAAVTAVDIRTDYKNAPTFSPTQQQAALSVLAADETLVPYYITSLRINALMRLYSLQYTQNDWIFTGEYLTIDINLNKFGVANFNVPNYKTKLNGYYAQAEWLASNKLSAYSRYEELYYNTKDKNGRDYALRTGGNPVTQYNKALTLGARWYITSNFSTTAEYSINEGTAFINGQTNIDYSTLKKNWNMFILEVSYHF